MLDATITSSKEGFTNILMKNYFISRGKCFTLFFGFSGKRLNSLTTRLFVIL